MKNINQVWFSIYPQEAQSYAVVLHLPIGVKGSFQVGSNTVNMPI